MEGSEKVDAQRVLLPLLLLDSAPTREQVVLLQDMFARSFVLKQGAVSEEMSQAVVQMVTRLFESCFTHGAGAMANHELAAGFCALVLNTLLKQVHHEKYLQLRVEILECVEMAWKGVPTTTLAAFLPGTAVELAKLLDASHDLRIQRRVVEAALSAFTTAIAAACCDADHESLLAEVDGQREVLDLSSLRCGSKRKEEEPVSPSPPSSERNPLSRVVFDRQWLQTVRHRLGGLLQRLFVGVLERSTRGTVHSELHPHLSGFARAAATLLSTSRRMLHPAAAVLVEVGLASALVDDTPPLNAVLEAAKALEADGMLTGRVRHLSEHVGSEPHLALPIAGWVRYVLQSRAASLYHTDVLHNTLRGLIRVVSRVGSADFDNFSAHKGSILGNVAEAARALTTYLPILSLTTPLLNDLSDFSRWRFHHPTAWLLRCVCGFAWCSEVQSIEERVDAVIGAITEVTSIPEFWYFDETGPPPAVTHRVVLCRLLVTLLATPATLLGSTAGPKERILLHTVFPALEKVASSHHELSSAALDVLSTLADAAVPQYPEDQRTARLIFECFDWVVDGVVARTPFLDDYPGTPSVLSSALKILHRLLDRQGAPDYLLVSLEHLLVHVAKEMLGTRKDPSLELAVLHMLREISGMLSVSVRRKQGWLFSEARYASSASVCTVALAAVAAIAAADRTLLEGVEDEPEGNRNLDVPVASDESVLCMSERRLLLTVLGKAQHYLTHPSLLGCGDVCAMVEQAVLGFSTYDGVSDRLQCGRRTDPPLPEVVNGEVVDVVSRWWSGSDHRPPTFLGGFNSTALHSLHLLWSAIMARLLPPGFVSADELSSRLTLAHRKHLNSTSVSTRLRKWQLPTVDLGAVVVHLVKLCAYMVVYSRDFMEDRVKKELWPALRYHLVLSPHLFYEFAGARPAYVHNTMLCRFQCSCLRLLLLLFPPSLATPLDKAAADPSTHRFSQYNPQAFRPLLEDVLECTERFLDPRQPKDLVRLANALRDQLSELLDHCPLPQ